MEMKQEMDCPEEEENGHRALIIEPFYGGSHKQLIDVLMERVPSCVKYTLPAKKWHWKARTSALHFAQIVPRNQSYKVLFASSVLNLAELVALRADLAGVHKVLYFHENQLIYPIRKQQDRDFQFGYNQIISCLVADTVLFNSRYNMESFLSSIESFLGVIPVPDYRLKGTASQIRPKCRVLYFPLELPSLENLSCNHVGGCRQSSVLGSNDSKIGEDPTRASDSSSSGRLSEDCLRTGEMVSHDAGSGDDESKTQSSRDDLENVSLKLLDKSSQAGMDGSEGKDGDSHSKEANEQTGDCNRHVSPGEGCPDLKSTSQHPLHILWAHRWEHDKNPDLFFHTVMKLHDLGLDFRLSVLGEKFSEVPDVFSETQPKLMDHIINWGYLPSKVEYYKVLLAADVAVSTANHEFFGVAMLEAVHCGCYPLCPNRLVYPEIFPQEYLYSTPQQLFKRLREFCRHPHLIRKHILKCDISKFSWEKLRCDYLSLLDPTSLINREETPHSEVATAAIPSEAAQVSSLSLS
ncbi:glycosyltransferase-like domain-containing protein 1 isoform X1 [Asterias rubens]|uniref:glycosyltransferase-like domain-containing protein 1 isoform X1 n=2 Tax=Asterias rubens TaxID=7604 RepID=UPI00145569B0|nr:glycosyltransferase-like domain-containing protein 1 isoform X1 [Asterias rubens]